MVMMIIIAIAITITITILKSRPVYFGVCTCKANFLIDYLGRVCLVFPARTVFYYFGGQFSAGKHRAAMAMMMMMKMMMVPAR